MSQVDDVVAEFLVESGEYLDQVDQDLVALEADPGSHQIIGRIFRAVHTIKGGCGFLQFHRLEKVTHVGENLLSCIRDGVVSVTPEINDALLALNDLLRATFEEVAATGAEPAGDDSELIALLSAMLPPTQAAAPGAAGAARAVPAARNAGAPPAGDRPPVPRRSSRQEVLAARAAEAEAEAAAACSAQAELDVAATTSAAAAAPRAVVAKRSSRQEMLAARQGEAGGPGGAAASSGAPAGALGAALDATVRIDVAVLDVLMNLVGELVLARNQLAQVAGDSVDPRLNAPTQRLSHITSELQEGVMKTRMQPISGVWGKLPRVVRDLARGCGKEVTLEMEGAETELDRTLIEAIKDPITHLVRNAIDHGIEDPADRVAAGKPAKGVLTLRAFHAGGKVNIQITEDGAGINTERVRAKAVEKGLVSPEEAERLSSREIHNLIFLPGFSTAATVTNISGRGVGMDVVKTNMERVGGSVDVSSQPGVGTTFTLKIPMTLAIVPALLVRSGGQRYAISQLSLKELLRLDSRVEGVVEWMQGVPLHRLRGRLLPLVDLAAVLGQEPIVVPGRVLNTVVLQIDDQLFGLVVDDIADTQEIVVKALSKQVADVGLFSGATIMGDGRVALILDVAGIAAATEVLNGAREWSALSDADRQAAEAVETVSTLLIDVGDGRRAGIPLESVMRLEEFSPRSLEWVGPREVVQYQNEIMPLIRAGELLGFDSPLGHDRPGSLNVLVCRLDDHKVGLVVEGVADIVDVPVDHEDTMVLNGRVTELVDMIALVRSFDYTVLRK
jgi:two-component system, chemotaxis family, sensor kinase CheA